MRRIPHPRQLRHKTCLEILARAYHQCTRVVHAACLGLSLARPDWRWPKSHASLVLVAAVHGIVHKVAQTCTSCNSFRAGQNLASYARRSVWPCPKSRPDLTIASHMHMMHDVAEGFDVNSLCAASLLVRRVVDTDI